VIGAVYLASFDAYPRYLSQVSIHNHWVEAC
jgi:hypothetical protein